MNSLKGKFSLIACVFCCAFALLLAALFLHSASNSAYAADNNPDTYEVLFPENEYLQTENPILIAANGERIAIYDADKKVVFSLNADGSLSKFDLSDLINIPNSLYLMEGAAFLVCEDGNYILNLSDASNKVSPVTLPSPASASYYSGDGKYIYAKSAFGSISVFGYKGGALSPVYENAAFESLTGKNVIAGIGDLVYSFSFEYGVPLFCAIDLKNDAESENPMQNGKIKYASASASAVFASDGESLYALNKENGNLLFDAEINPSAFCAYGNKLYAIGGDGRIEIYSVKQDLSGITLLSSIGMSGSDERHLNSPKDAAVFDGATVIADTGNNRLVFLRGKSVNTLNLGFSPLALACGETEIFAAGEHKISVISKDGSTRDYEFEQTIIDVAYADKLYVLASDGLYTLFAGKLIKLNDSAGLRITSAEDGKFIYLLAENSVLMLDENGNIAARIDADSGAKDIYVDYAGNLFLLFSDKIIKYANTLSALTPLKTYPIFRANFTASPQSLCFIGADSVLFAAKESFIGKLSAQCVTKESYMPPAEPDIPNDAEQRFLRLKEGKTSFVFGLSGRTEDFNALSDNTSLLAFPALTDAAGACIALYNGEKVKIIPDDYATVTPAPINAEYIAEEACGLLYYPGSETARNLNAGEHVIVADNAAGFDSGKWLRVKVSDKFYYAPVAALKPVISDKPEIVKTYGKVKADRVGGTVGLLAAADSASEIVAEIVDGKKVEIIQTLENFYFVRYGDITGYIKKEYVVLDGLTTVQIIAIAVSVAVLLAGAVVFAAVYQAKKKNDKKA